MIGTTSDRPDQRLASRYARSGALDAVYSR